MAVAVDFSALSVIGIDELHELFRHRVEVKTGQAKIIDLRDARVLVQKLCHFLAVLTDQIHPAAQRPDIIQRKHGVHGRGRRSLVPVR